MDGNCTQMLEKAVLSTAGRDSRFLGEAPKLGSGVESEGEEVKCNEEAGQGAFAVSKVVLKVVAAGLQDIKSLIFDLPAGAPAFRQFGYSVSIDGQIGNE